MKMAMPPSTARRGQRRDLDILIGGGGVVGAATAVLLARQSATCGLTVGLVEPRPPLMPVPGSAWDLRVFALSRASQHVLQAAGVWPVVSSRAHAYQGMRVWDASDTADSPRALAFSAAEAGESDLGHMTEVVTLQAALYAAALQAGVRLFTAPVTGLEISADHARITLADGEQLRAGLVVAAEGRDSPIRGLAGIEASVHDYQQSGVVAFLQSEQSHQEIAWQRFLPTGPLGLLPVADRRLSVVWTLPSDTAAQMLAMDEAAFNAAITTASDGVLGALRLDSARVAVPLRRVTAKHYGVARVALVGDAAHAVHPLAGQGANLGLLDAAALVQVVAEALARGEDPGDAGPVGRYARWRRAEAAPLTLGVHGLQWLFGSSLGPVVAARRTGLGWVGSSAWLRRQFITHALGLAGEVPRLALTGQRD